MSDQKVYENSRFTLYQRENDGVYLHERLPEYVTVILLHTNQLIVVQQYREAVGRETIELPGGRLEGAESPAAAARRELLEETGLTCGELHYVGSIDSYACLINRRVHFFFADQILDEAVQQLDDDEAITVLRVPLGQVIENLRKGTWTDSELASGLLLAKLRGFVEF